MVEHFKCGPILKSLRAKRSLLQLRSEFETRPVAFVSHRPLKGPVSFPRAGRARSLDEDLNLVAIIHDTLEQDQLFVFLNILLVRARGTGLSVAYDA